jgi:hypothetical protein
MMKISRINPIAIRANPRIVDPIVMGREGASTRKSFSCPVSTSWTDKIARKMQASKEVWGHLFGTINTREKFLDQRLELALA